MKTTTSSSMAFLLLATLAFSSCVLLASAQDEEWYEPNADYSPEGYNPQEGMGYYLNCADADKNYFTLQKLHKCQDPYVLSAHQLQDTNRLAGYIDRICKYVETQYSRYGLAEYSNTDNSVNWQLYNYHPFQPGYPGYPWGFAQMKSTEKTSTTSTKKSSSSSSSEQSVLDATPAFLQHKMKQYAANAAVIEAAKQQKQQQQDQVLLLETEAKTQTKINWDGNDGVGPYYGWYTQEDCFKGVVADPSFRDPVTASDIERLIAFDLLFIVYSAQLRDTVGDQDTWRQSEERCTDVLLPMFTRTGHFPGNGVTDNTQARYDFFRHSFNEWYEYHVGDAFDWMCGYY